MKQNQTINTGYPTDNEMMSSVFFPLYFLQFLKYPTMSNHNSYNDKTQLLETWHISIYFAPCDGLYFCNGNTFKSPPNIK